MDRITVFILCQLAVVAVPTAALAHPAIDDAIARSDEADFDGALAAFERAESSDELSLDDLASLYAHRAAVHVALGNAAEAQADLRRLVAIAPSYALDASASPALHDALARVRTTERVSIRVVTQAGEGTTHFRAVVDHDPGGLVRRVRLMVRAVGDGRWTETDGASYDGIGAAFEYFAEAIGPGGVVVARQGSESEPSRAGELPAAIAAGDQAAPEDFTVWWVVGGAGLAVIVAVVAGVAVASSGPSDQTAFGPPMLRMP